MSKRVETISAKGIIVDFDLLRLKQQIGTTPKPLVVEARENFIDNKFKRKLNRQLNKAVENMPTDEDFSSSDNVSVPPAISEELVIKQQEVDDLKIVDNDVTPAKKDK